MKRYLLILLALLMVLGCFVACSGGADASADTESDTETEEVTESETEEVTETESETEATPVVVLPDFVNPLTGLGTTKDLYSSRPVAIMINNLKKALPQIGISDCDIMYECLVEGGITRLMAVVSDYESLDVIGSVRSCRHYYIDLAQNYDAIYIHAGGSDQGYLELKQRGINNLDGVNMYIPDMFYRDEDRRVNMGYEHSLMTTGENIAAGIAYKKYRTELSEDFKNKDAFNFVSYGSERIPVGEDALCITLPYSKYQTARFDYDEMTNSYYRYQFITDPHIDGATGQQINFTNILVLFCNVVNLGDTYGHLDITTEKESGEGYYIYGGKYEPITWSKPTEDSPTVYYGADGEELEVNRGKTFISIFPDYNRENIEFNYVVDPEN